MQPEMPAGWRSTPSCMFTAVLIDVWREVMISLVENRKKTNLFLEKKMVAIIKKRLKKLRFFIKENARENVGILLYLDVSHRRPPAKLAKSEHSNIRSWDAAVVVRTHWILKLLFIVSYSLFSYLRQTSWNLRWKNYRDILNESRSHKLGR